MKVIEQKIRSLYHSTVFLWLLSAFFHIFSFSCVCLCRHFVCFSSVSRPRTQILSVFILAAILNKFPLSVDKSVTWFLLCARVFSPAAAILESEKTLGTRLGRLPNRLRRWAEAGRLRGLMGYSVSCDFWRGRGGFFGVKSLDSLENSLSINLMPWSRSFLVSNLPTKIASWRFYWTKG